MAKWLVLAGVCVGLGFETKMLVALVVVPGIAAAWLWMTPSGRGRLHALRQLLAGGSAMLLVAGAWPALGDGACSNAGAGCVTRERAALMVGTSAAVRVVYEADRAVPRPGLFLYRLDARRFCEGGALSDGGNLHAWLRRTLQELPADEPADRPPAGHGLTFLPFLGGERSLGWDPERRGLIAGLSFATTPADIAQAALEGVAYRLADVLGAIGDVESVVATGGGLLANPGWLQVLADVLGRPVEVSGEPEGSARGAAVVALERLGLPVPPAPVARIVEPRLDRYEIHLHATQEQRRLMQLEEDQ